MLETTFAQETELDLFAEQGVWPIIMRDLLLSYEVLVEAGFPPEMVALELYGSGEAAEIFRQMARRGVIQPDAAALADQPVRDAVARADACCPTRRRPASAQALDEIRSGGFAREWTAEQESGYPKFEALRRRRAHEHQPRRSASGSCSRIGDHRAPTGIE